MDVRPVSQVNPAFARWMDRHRERIQAQLVAIEGERFEDLAELIDDEREDPPPQPRSEGDREAYRGMLLESEELTRRLGQIRSRLLVDLREVERQQVRGAFPKGRGHLGGALDGYL